ncbi:hypothetical protein H4582DRAFT_1895092 [Lactarius indigo]|nr:hypothetical protein H4582DRAFT_1895092 [Lactarius indigo]
MHPHMRCSRCPTPMRGRRPTPRCLARGVVESLYSNIFYLFTLRLLLARFLYVSGVSENTQAFIPALMISISFWRASHGYIFDI